MGIKFFIHSFSLHLQTHIKTQSNNYEQKGPWLSIILSPFSKLEWAAGLSEVICVCITHTKKLVVLFLSPCMIYITSVFCKKGKGSNTSSL